MWDKSGLSGNWIVNSLGILQNDVNGSSLDTTLTIKISKGTELLNDVGKPLSELSVAPIDPPDDPPDGYHLLSSFNFTPDGAKFDPGITITLSFDASALENGETLVLAFYNETDGTWEFIEGTDNGDGTATFNITHFSVYYLLSRSAENTSTPPIWIWIVIGGAVAAILLLAVLIYRRVYK
jgi:hypothetical protein